jgi:hypothetical protein
MEKMYERPRIVDEVVIAPKSGACQLSPPTIYESYESNVTGGCDKDDPTIPGPCDPNYGQWQRSH